MTERELILLGFKSESIKEDGEEDTYYYVLDIADGLTFITPTNDEIRDDKWYVEVFNTDPLVRFHESNELGVLINTLKNAIVNKK